MLWHVTVAWRGRNHTVTDSVALNALGKAVEVLIHEAGGAIVVVNPVPLR